MRFQWDVAKAVANLRKHGVTGHRTATDRGNTMTLGTRPSPAARALKLTLRARTGTVRAIAKTTSRQRRTPECPCFIQPPFAPRAGIVTAVRIHFP